MCIIRLKFDKMMHLVILLGFTLCVPSLSQSTLREVIAWKQLDFEFPSIAERNNAIRDRKFIPENCVPIDTDIDHRGRKRNFFRQVATEFPITFQPTD